MSGIMDPAFKDKQPERIKEARLELQGKLLLAFCGDQLIGQCAWSHPGMIRHFEQLERIFGYNITNKEWMFREITAMEAE